MVRFERGLLGATRRFDGLAETARVIKEVFGPCCHIAPFDTEEEVLAKRPMTTNLDGGLDERHQPWQQHRVAQRMKLGLAWVKAGSCAICAWRRETPGIGREGGVHLEFYT